MGYWRLMDWNMSPQQLVSFIEEHLDLGVTTVDHADIYGGYLCEAAFWRSDEAGSAPAFPYGSGQQVWYRDYRESAERHWSLHH
jgi:Predicted oxidoreductase